MGLGSLKIAKMTAVGLLALAVGAMPGIGEVHAAEEEEVSVPSAMPGEGPFLYQTAEQSRMKVEVVARGLAHGYSLAFLPGGDLLIVERGQRLRLLRGATTASPRLESAAIADVPTYGNVEHLHRDDLFGIQDVVAHPEFAKNGLLYFTYNRPEAYDAGADRVKGSIILARAKLDGLRLTKKQDLIVGEPVIGTGGSRIIFDGQGSLFVSVGGLSTGDVEASQRTDNIYGKVLRIRPDGTIPADNPFFGTSGARKEVWTYGHRDPLGLAIDPRSGRLVASEHGPQGGDEINLLMPGRNYGWPTFSYGTVYGGSKLPHAPVGQGTEGPLMVWMPAIAPNGITFYTGDAMPGWKNNLFVTSARRGQINGTGSLVRVVTTDDLDEKRQEALLTDLHQRFKDVKQGPDGYLYALTDEAESVVLRLRPAE